MVSVQFNQNYDLKAAIWDSDKNLLAVSSTIVNVADITPQWRDIAFTSSYYVSSSESYYFGVIGGDNTGTWRSYYNAGTSGEDGIHGNNYTTPVDLGVFILDALLFSICITVETGSPSSSSSSSVSSSSSSSSSSISSSSSSSSISSSSSSSESSSSSSSSLSSTPAAVPVDLLGHSWVGVAFDDMHIYTSEYYASFYGFRACDGQLGGPNNYWIGLGSAAWWKVDLGVGNVAELNNLDIVANTIPEPNRMPKNFTIQGSMNDVDYDILYTSGNETGWGSGESRNFIMSAGGEYRWFKIDITDNNGDASFTVIAEVYFWGTRA